MAQIFNKMMVLAGLATLALLLGIPAGKVQAQSNAAPEREQLLNGLTILYGNRPGDPNVVLKLRIKSGAVFDLAGKAGGMALLADAMFPESSTRDYVSEQLGGRLEVTTTYDSIDVTISGKSSELERMIELIRNAVINVNLSAESVATLRVARIKQLGEKPSGAELADRAVASRLFGSYPYGSPTQGTAESVAKLERADLMLERDRFLNAENATLVIVGGVEKARALRALRQLLGPWQKGDRIVPATFRQPGTVDDRVLLIDAPGAANVEVRLAVRGLSRSDADATAALVLAQIAQRRWQAQMAELASSSVRNETYALGGIFVFSASVPAASAGKAIAAAKNVMKTLAEADATQEEITSATAPGLWLSHRPSPDEALADAWLDADTYKLSNTNRQAEAMRLPAAELRRTAARLFGNSAPLAIVALGNAAELQSQLGYKIELRTNAPEPKPSIKPAMPPRKP